jgi:aromatic ring-opening dioxygenase LigB subunit
MPLEVIYFSPHGMQIIPGLENPYNESFRSLHEAMLTLSWDVCTHELDYLILVTPHGLALEKPFGIVQNEWLRGYLPYLTRSNVDGDKIFQTLEVPGGSKESRLLLLFLKDQGVDCTSMIFGAKSFPFPLAWGELVPLYYLETLNNLQIPVILISIPQQRYKMNNFFEKMHHFGSQLGEFMGRSSNKFGLVLSGDLSHVHQDNGPYGYHSHSQIFDDAICSYLKTLSSSVLQKSIENYADTALACGLSNLIVLDELVKMSSFNSNEKIHWNNEFLEYAAPTYFGMAVSMFKKRA